MIGRIMKKCSAMFLYVCVATILAQAIGIGALLAANKLSREKMDQIVAVLHGATLAAPGAEDGGESSDEAAAEQPSFSEVEHMRAVKSRNLELRESVLDEGLTELKHIQRELVDEVDRFDQVVNAFEARLDDRQVQAQEQSVEAVRQLMELMKPKQAKDQMLRMLEAGEMDYVVLVVRTMNDAKRKKVLDEFRTADDQLKLFAILEKIRAQDDVNDAIEEAAEQLGR
jgi:hypothetical protein